MGGGVPVKWFYRAGPGGTIACKGNYPAEAKAEAADRWGCGSDEITVAGEEPFNNGAPMYVAAAAADKTNAAPENAAP